MPENVDTLNRLLQIVNRSLPMYLADADPWVADPEEPAAVGLRNIVADQRKLAERIADEILDRREQPNPGEFPMAYTDLNDVSLDYLLGELAHRQRRDIAAIEHCVQELNGDPRAHSLAEEALGAAKAHLEQLEELTGEPATA